MKDVLTDPTIVFETSWEVCNKVGGIYAVLSTKARTLQRQNKDMTIFVGPDIWSEEIPSPYFKPQKTALQAWRKSGMLPERVKVRVGRWMVPGTPIAILVDYKSLYAEKDELYSMMWEHFGVDSLHAYGDYDESCIFAYAAALVVESYVAWMRSTGDNTPVVAHFDEWTTGMGLLHVKATMPEVATVFTTHATCIGRSICGNGKDLYDYMPGYNGDQMSTELNMQSKHSLEKAAAQQADAFTTVSDVTATECRQLLEASPIVTPNAFEQDFVPKGKKMTETRAAARERLLLVAERLTGEHFDADTLLVGTSGRCEYRNKGLDVYLDSACICRDRFASASRKVIFFVMVPSWVKAPRTDLKEAMTATEAGARLANPIITHEMHDAQADSIYRKMQYLGFDNKEADNVKVIYIPSYLNGDDGIVNMAYYDVLTGLDVSVFGSYYEPWGYTPMESVAFGVPTVTTDLAGFGQWVIATYGNDVEGTGVKVVHRTDSNYDEVLSQVVEFVEMIHAAEPAQVAKMSKNAQKVAKLASWDNFVAYYHNAYAVAKEKAQQRAENK